MRYAIALLVSVLVIRGMFAFAMSTRYAVEEWARTAVALSPAQMLRGQIAMFWWQYGKPISLVLVGLSLLIARVTQPDTKNNRLLRR